jgi:hypothetical protein
VGTERRVNKHSLAKAYEQIPRGVQPCLVIICPSTSFPIDEDDMLNALLGHLAVRLYLKQDKPIKTPETFRRADGFFHPRRNRKISAVGLYRGRSGEKRLEIYHNPYTINPIPARLFMNVKEGIRQLVRASNIEMEWLG